MTPKIPYIMNPYDHFIRGYSLQEPALKRAMAQHSNAQTFTVVATNTEGVFNFVPNHLVRFIPKSAVRLLTMNYPRGIDPLTALEEEAKKLQGNVPNRFVLGDTINSIIVQPIRLSHFHNILTAIKHAKEYTPELVTLMTYDYGEITKQFRARIAPHVTKARKQFKSLGVTMDNDTDTVITLSGKPLESVNVVWNWLRLTPEDADALSPEKLWEKQKRLYALRDAVERLGRSISITEYTEPESYVLCCKAIQREIHYEAGDHL